MSEQPCTQRGTAVHALANVKRKRYCACCTSPESARLHHGPPAVRPPGKERYARIASRTVIGTRFRHYVAHGHGRVACSSKSLDGLLQFRKRHITSVGGLAVADAHANRSGRRYRHAPLLVLCVRAPVADHRRSSSAAARREEGGGASTDHHASRGGARPGAPRAAAPPVAAQAAPRPPAFVQVPILAVFDETRDIRTFRMARPDGFEFKAGQFLAVRVRADGQEHVRCYSVSSAPGSRGHLEISVKRLGVVSGTLHATLRPGSMLSVKAPVGAFTYPAGEDRPIVLIGGGVGITPLMSMLRHAIDEEPTRPVTLFYSVRTQEDIAFVEELRLLDRRHPQFRAVFAITEGDVPPDCYSCRINEELLLQMAPDI